MAGDRNQGTLLLTIIYTLSMLNYVLTGAEKSQKSLGAHSSDKLARLASH